MRLRVKNLMQERNNEYLYNLIDLNHIFNDDDILDEWIRERQEPILSSDNLNWLDKGLPTNEEGRETIHEDDGTTNHRVSRRTSNITQERDVDSRRKGKALIIQKCNKHYSLKIACHIIIGKPAFYYSSSVGMDSTF